MKTFFQFQVPMTGLPSCLPGLRLACSLVPPGTAGIGSVDKLESGLQVRAGDQLVRLEVFAEGIIHVQASQLESIPDHAGYMVVPDNRRPVPFEIAEHAGEVLLRTAQVAAHVDRKSGAVRFTGPDGQLLLSEEAGGRTFTPVTVLGEATSTVQQAWELGEVKVIHGLGGQQNGVINYVGKDALLAQYNVIDVNTFFMTDRNWGILWDNNSITRFGDPREYQPINCIDLVDTTGEPGALTAEYFSDNAFSQPFVTRRESEIRYDFIEDLPRRPEGFSLTTGSVRWSGTLTARESGLHKFELYGSHYAKVWMDNVLVVDRWRQNWMPYSNFFELDLEQGVPVQVRIEWICNDGYHGFKVLTPEPPGQDKRIRMTSEVGDKVDYYFVHGTDADEVIRRYRVLTGEAPLMPKWALGKWQCRERYKTQEELLEVVREFRRRRIPLDAIVQDWNYWPDDEWGNHTFDKDRFPDPVAMVDELHNSLNTHVMISVWPKFYKGIRNYQRFLEKGWLYMRNIEKKALDWIGKGYESTFYDAFNPEAADLFWITIDEALFSKGFDAWWLDATEPDVHSNTSVEERKLRMHPTHTGSGARNFNAYSINNSRGVYEGQRSTRPDQRVFILTRSSFAGQQRYASATWSGDIAARWSDFKQQIAFGINFSAAGIPYWTTDIGGFGVEPRFEHPNADDLEEWRELQLRWYQFGVFCPLFRVHGQFPFREIFHIAPEGHPAYSGMLDFDKLRYRLMPYIYGLAGQVTHAGYSFTRPLMMDFASDDTAVNCDDQFLFGRNILVCPVTEYQARQRRVYLPRGTDWYDMRTGQRLAGGQSISADAPLTEMPLYARAGSIIPLGADIQYVDELPDAPVEIRVYPGADAVFTLYDDEGLTYDYENGAFSMIELTWTEASQTLVIGKRYGHYAGMPAERIFHVVLVDDANGNSLHLSPVARETVRYSGEPVTVRL